MLKNTLLSATVAALTIAQTAIAQPTGDAPGQNGVPSRPLSPQAKITFHQAEQTALTQRPGTTREIELKWDKDRLVYEIEIDTVKNTVEVEVDAVSGGILNIKNADDKSSE